MDSTYIYAGNLPYDCTEELLAEAFAPFGKVEEVKLARSRDEQTNGLFMGYGFVKMGSEEEATTAIKEMQGKVFNGRECHLEPGVQNEALWEKAFGG